jgi:hypothetical protein
MKIILIIFAILFGLLTAALLVTIQAALILFGWNILAPLFHGPAITWAQAYGIAALLSVIGAIFRGAGGSSRKD